MSRRWLIALSALAHICIAGGLWATGVWGIERLEGKPRVPALALMQPAPAPSGGPKNPKPPTAPKLPPKVHRTVVNTHVQLPPSTVIKPAEPDTGQKDGTGGSGGPGGPDDTGKCLENCGPMVTEPLCGNSAVEAGEQCDDGNTSNGDGCSSTCRLEPKPPPAVAGIAPTVMRGLRTSGEEQIHPSSSTQNLMLRDGATRVSGVVKVCIAVDGSIASASMSVSTKYDDYDATLLSAVRNWRYRPYTVNGTPVPACSPVTFRYTIK